MRLKNILRRVGGVAFLAAAGYGALATVNYQGRLKSASHTPSSAVAHNTTNALLRGIGGYRYKKTIESGTKDAKNEQDKFLKDVLEKQKDTIYGKDHLFEMILSEGAAEGDLRSTFIAKHPITYYDHYEAYVRRVYEGENNVMTQDKPQTLAMTSGTSGKSKMIPTTKDVSTIFFINGILPLFNVMDRNFSSMRNLQKTLKLVYTPRFKESPAGIKVGPNSSNPEDLKKIEFMYSTPMEAFDVTSELETLYVHLLFALKDKNLGIIEANFAHSIYTAMQYLRTKWPQLIKDIRMGKIDSELNISPNVRKSLENQLIPDEQRADELEKQFELGFDGIVKRIWPHFHLILTVDTGSAELYGNLLRAHECQSVTFYSPIYAATEGLMGLNLSPCKEEREYTLLPANMFFEFIPIETVGEKNPPTLFMDQVEKDKIYELVITNISGLYRYRLGDVIQITGFYNNSPSIQFMYRQGQFLNVRGEKTSEQLFYNTLDTVSRAWEQKGVEVTDYCCAESALVQMHLDNDNRQSAAPFYAVFVESRGKPLSKDYQVQLDEELQEHSYAYKSFRQKGSINSLQVYTVPPGTFAELKQYLMESTEVSSNQYKVPRVLKKPDVVKFMLEKSACPL